MKLTDEKVAKALGWKHYRLSGTWARGAVGPAQDGQYQVTCPAFTTSLDAIVAELEARGLAWQAWHSESGGYGALLAASRFCHESTSVPLALCAALLEYLKAKPTGGTE